MSIERRRLGEQIFDVLSGEIIDGQHPAGKHMNELEICAALNVSRTPVREALFKLEQQGLLNSRPNQGFFVAPLSRQKVEESYPILASLESLALRLSDPFSEKDTDRLQMLNQRLQATTKSKLQMYKADRDFHSTLLKSCPNKSLLYLISELKDEIKRWDGGQLRGVANPDKAVKEHSEILECLKAGDNERAAKLVEKHWYEGIDTVTQWIKQQDQNADPDDKSQTA